MAFWARMTIAEMSLLLEEKDQPDIETGWRELSDLISQIPIARIDSVNKELSDNPFFPAVYFFLCVQESAGYTADSPLPQPIPIELNRTMHLPAFDYSRGPTRNFNAFANFYTSPFTMTLYPPTTSLGKLLKEIRADNYKQWDQAKRTGKGRQYLMTKALDSLERTLNNWDESCKRMWISAKRAVCTPLCENDPTFKKIYDLVEGGVKQIVLTGAPGTGKTRTAGLAARYMGTPLAEYGTDPEHPYPLVQFHPSYDYTDFVEGLRPVQLKGQDDGPARFVKLDGSFKAFCRSVAKENRARTENPKNDPDRRYFFLIDEINRADLSKVFGELMFCLEAGKRGISMQTQYCNLPTYVVDKETQQAAKLKDDVFAGGFFIPENVIILGTMNDIDRSVESIDFALRRRFVFWEVKVGRKMLQRAFESGGFGQVLKDNAETVAERVMALNGVMDRDDYEHLGLNRQFYISQGQFAGLPEKQTLDEVLRSAWEIRIEPLLREYVRGEDNVTSFLNACRAKLGVKQDKQEPDL